MFSQNLKIQLTVLENNPSCVPPFHGTRIFCSTAHAIRSYRQAIVDLPNYQPKMASVR